MQRILMIIICLILPFTALNVCASDKTSYYYDGRWHDYNEQPISLKINGDIVNTEVPPIILNDRTLVPVRSVFEKIGAQVSWDSKNKKVKISFGSTSVELTIDSKKAYVNGTAYSMDMPAKIINDARTMIPVRFVAERLGLSVEWDSKAKLVSISKPSAEEIKNENIPGIDVSNWQGEINFSEVKASGIKVVYIKATEGMTYTDPNLKDNYEGASKSGLKIGFYHFLRANDPIDEAKNFLNSVKGYSADCKYMIDVESAYGQTPEQVSSNVRKFADYLKSQGKDVGIYTFLNFHNNYLDDSVKDLPLWIAQYDVTEPEIPCIGWQNSSKGTVKGIAGNVDTNFFGNGIYAGGTGDIKRMSTIKESGTKTVNVQTSLNVRSSPSTAADIIGELSNGDRINYSSYIISPNNEVWYRFNYNGQEGYVIGEYLKG